MSLIRMVGFEVDGSPVSVEIPSKKTVFVRGRLREHFLYVVESLLARDVTGYYGELDMQAGKHYRDLDGELFLLFNDGGIQARDKVVQVNGIVPSTHVIRYIGVDDKFRSFCLEQGLTTYSTVYTDMRDYSHVINDAKWVRLVMTVNDLLGFEFAVLEDGHLRFNPLEGHAVSPEGQKFMYMLMAECYLTPANVARRVLLLSDIPYLDKELQLKFLKKLSDIPGLSLILSTADVDFTDIKEGSSISFLSV